MGIYRLGLSPVPGHDTLLLEPETLNPFPASTSALDPSRLPHAPA